MEKYIADLYTDDLRVAVFIIKDQNPFSVRQPCCFIGKSRFFDDGDTSENVEAFEKVVRIMKEAGIGYGAINHPVDRDPVCGYVGVIKDVCPKCGRRDGEGVPMEKINGDNYCCCK